MNQQKLVKQLRNNDTLKFVGTLVPPVLFIARYTMERGLKHRQIAQKYHVDTSNPTFRAGFAIAVSKKVILNTDGSSLDFPSHKPTRAEFKKMMKGSITLDTVV